DCVDRATGEPLDLHFQEYWVRRRAADPVTRVRYAGADVARPAPGVLEALAEADAVVWCPSNPVVSIGPILAVPEIREAVAARRARAVGVSGIVGGGPVSGMADKLMPAVGIEVSAAGVADHYAPLLSAWLVDRTDAGLVPRIEAAGLRCGAVDTIMTDDDRAEAVARAALELLA
ncbi:MAG TPA: 2-phospho-L-lactate transferase CofD family protein, partial [Actinomycetota bacterium]